MTDEREPSPRFGDTVRDRMRESHARLHPPLRPADRAQRDQREREAERQRVTDEEDDGGL